MPLFHILVVEKWWKLYFDGWVMFSILALWQTPPEVNPVYGNTIPVWVEQYPSSTENIYSIFQRFPFTPKLVISVMTKNLYEFTTRNWENSHLFLLCVLRGTVWNMDGYQLFLSWSETWQGCWGFQCSGSPILLPFSLTLLPSVLRKGNKSGGISEVKTFLDSYNINIGKKT